MLIVSLQIESLLCRVKEAKSTSGKRTDESSFHSMTAALHLGHTSLSGMPPLTDPQTVPTETDGHSKRAPLDIEYESALVDLLGEDLSSDPGRRKKEGEGRQNYGELERTEQRNKSGELGRTDERHKHGKFGRVEERHEYGELGRTNERHKRGDSGRGEESDTLAYNRVSLAYLSH